MWCTSAFSLECLTGHKTRGKRKYPAGGEFIRMTLNLMRKCLCLFYHNSNYIECIHCSRHVYVLKTPEKQNTISAHSVHICGVCVCAPVCECIAFMSVCMCLCTYVCVYVCVSVSLCPQVSGDTLPLATAHCEDLEKLHTQV